MIELIAKMMPRRFRYRLLCALIRLERGSPISNLDERDGFHWRLERQFIPVTWNPPTRF